MKTNSTLGPLAILILLGCLAGAVPSDAAQADAPKPATYPKLAFLEEGETSRTSRVTWNGQLLVEVRENKKLRFRATPRDQNWIGSEKSPIDLGWVYRDEGAKGMVALSVNHENDPKTGRFVLRISGRKPQFDSRIEIVLTGTWMPEAGKFKYTLNTRLSCPLESWYEHSTATQRGRPVKGERKLWTEVLDYCIEGISLPERLMSPNPQNQHGPLMYEWFVSSPDGRKWQKWPKVHIPYPVRQGDYLTIHDRAHPMLAGGYYGHLDKQHGGWLTRINSTPVPVIHEICWARFDVHISLEGAIPPRHSMKELALGFELAFEPVAPAKAREIVKNALEIPWRQAPEYNLPLFAWNTRCDKILTDLPGEETAQHLVWWPSDYVCDRDGTTGYDDHYSLTIHRKPSSAQKSSAWSTFAWHWPFNEHMTTNRRIRFSAMVKTQNCTGSVRLGHYSTLANLGDVFYGGTKSHKMDGTPRTDGIIWEYSKPLTGTTDWTPLTLEFVVKHFSSTVILEQTGSGQCWFDNVRIEDLGKARPGNAQP